MFSSLMAFLTLAIYMILPIMIVYILYYHYKRGMFNDEKYIERYGAITEDIRTRSRMHLAYPLMGYSLRLTLILLLLSDDIFQQLLFYRIIFLLYFIYIGIFKPKVSPAAHSLELLHLSFFLCHN